MANFESLPSEIHDKIFEEVISSTLPSPDYEQELQEDRLELNDVQYIGYGGGRRVKWQKTQTPHPADALLLVNRRVRAETKVAWKRVAHTLPCHADIMFAAEADLRPTFLSVYTDATHFDVVHAQFRVVGLPDPAVFGPEVKTSNPRGIWSAYDDNVPHVDWMFFDLLHRFLKAGPRLSQPEQVDRHITIQRLEIDVLSPACDNLLPDKEALRFWHLARRAFPLNIRRRLPISDAEMESLRGTQMRPEWLCDWIAGNIRRLTEMDYKTMEYGGIFYERIGEIAVLLDGEEKAAFKLGEMLSELPKGDPWGFTIRERRQEWFGKWKERTIKERLEAARLRVGDALPSDLGLGSHPPVDEQKFIGWMRSLCFLPFDAPTPAVTSVLHVVELHAVFLQVLLVVWGGKCRRDDLEDLVVDFRREGIKSRHAFRKTVKSGRARLSHPSDASIFCFPTTSCQPSKPREVHVARTFLSVYTDPTRFDVVHAQFRVVGLPTLDVFAPEEKISNPRDLWWEHFGSKPVNWMFFDLHRFLEAGPRLPQPERVDRRITVQRLEIDVLSPVDPSLLPQEGVWPSWLSVRKTRRPIRYSRDEEREDDGEKDLRRTQMRPEWLCDWISRNIRCVIEMDYKTMDYGGIFYERIGGIVVLLDGEEKAALQVG
ncbi:hypothetical protein C8R45DRAFT_1205293 [Mycena sanguinolenta]|nr:hypothetical protein C8R45DRAFT_1205293 [Mycena sanguinolenta]